jgi:DNA-binding beta-propeller fold protein YncE
MKRAIPIEIPPNFSPIEVWVEPDEQACFVTCRDEIGMSRPGIIAVIELPSGRTVKTLPAGIYPWHLVPDRDGKRLFINNFQSSRISIFDVRRREIVDSIIAQNGPSMMILTPEMNILIVSCFYTDKVLVVDLATKKVTDEISVDGNPTSLASSRDGNLLFVLCGGESTLDVIDMKTKRVVEKYPMLFGAYEFQVAGSEQGLRQ